MVCTNAMGKCEEWIFEWFQMVEKLADNTVQMVLNGVY